MIRKTTVPLIGEWQVEELVRLSVQDVNDPPVVFAPHSQVVKFNAFSVQSHLRSAALHPDDNVTLMISTHTTPGRVISGHPLPTELTIQVIFLSLFSAHGALSRSRRVSHFPIAHRLTSFLEHRTHCPCASGTPGTIISHTSLISSFLLAGVSVGTKEHFRRAL